MRSIPAPERGAGPSGPDEGPWTFDEVPADLLSTVDAARRDPTCSGLVVALPGGWGARALRLRLTSESPSLTVRGMAGVPAPGLTLALALEAAGIESEDADPASVLAAWVDACETRPLVVVESLRTVDARSLRLLADLAAQDRIFVLALGSVLDDAPEPFATLILTGRLRTWQVSALEPPAMAEHLARLLGSEPSSALVFSVYATTGGHRALVPVVLDAAVRSEVLSRTERLWHWADDADALATALHDDQARILGGFSQQTLDDLILFALAGSLAQHDAIAMVGMDRLARLRDQHLLEIEIDPDTAGRSLSIRPRLLESVLSRRVAAGEAARLWHRVGRNLTGAGGGAAAAVGTALWELRTGSRLGTARTAEIGEAALRCGRFSAAVRILDALPATDGDERISLLRARALAGAGEVRRPLHLLTQLARTDDPEMCRRAVILALRIGLFHRDAATGIITDLARRWRALDPAAATRSEALCVLLDYAVGTVPAEALSPDHAPLRHADAGESYVCRLWEGTELAFRLSPPRGNQILLSLFDEVSVDPGGSEFVEPTVVILTLLHAQFGWRPEIDLPRYWVQPRESDRVPAMAAAQDFVHAVRDMEADRMRTCFDRATGAARRTEDTDPYGLRPVCLALACAAASYVDPELGAAVRPAADESDDEGIPYVAHIRRGLLSIGQSPTTAEASEVMASLARTARAAGQRGQAIELSLFAMLGGNLDVARAIDADTGITTGGRDRTARLVAGAMLSGDPEVMLSVVDVLQGEGADYMSSTLLAMLWQNLPALGPWRRDTIRAALKARRAQTEPSWLLDSFAADLDLSERETRMLTDLRDGLTAAAIGRRLGLSVRSVEGIISRMLKRFSCANRIELLDLGLV